MAFIGPEFFFHGRSFERCPATTGQRGLQWGLATVHLLSLANNQSITLIISDNLQNSWPSSYFFFAAIIRSSCLLDVAPLFFLAGSRGLAAMNYQSLCNRLHVIAMRLEDESVDLEILPPLEAQKCLKTATWRDGMGRNCLKGMCWYITNFQLYIYNYMVICVHDICWFKEIPAWNHDIYIYIYIPRCSWGSCWFLPLGPNLPFYPRGVFLTFGTLYHHRCF